MVLLLQIRNTKQGMFENKDNSRILGLDSFEESMMPSPRFQRTVPLSRATGSHQRSLARVGSTKMWEWHCHPLWVWTAEHWVNENSSWDLWSNEICLIKFRTCLGPVIPFFCWKVNWDVLKFKEFIWTKTSMNPTALNWKCLGLFHQWELEENLV